MAPPLLRHRSSVGPRFLRFAGVSLNTHCPPYESCGSRKFHASNGPLRANGVVCADLVVLWVEDGRARAGLEAAVAQQSHDLIRRHRLPVFRPPHLRRSRPPVATRQFPAAFQRQAAREQSSLEAAPVARMGEFRSKCGLNLPALCAGSAGGRRGLPAAAQRARRRCKMYLFHSLQRCEGSPL